MKLTANLIFFLIASQNVLKNPFLGFATNVVGAKYSSTYNKLVGAGLHSPPMPLPQDIKIPEQMIISPIIVRPGHQKTKVRLEMAPNFPGGPTQPISFLGARALTGEQLGTEQKVILGNTFQIPSESQQIELDKVEAKKRLSQIESDFSLLGDLDIITSQMVADVKRMKGEAQVGTDNIGQKLKFAERVQAISQPLGYI